MDYTRLIEKINSKPDGEDVLRLRVGVVAAVAVNGTVTVTVSGVAVPGVPVLDGATLVVGAVVQLLSFRGSLMVIGSSGGISASGASRTGTVHGLSSTTSSSGVTTETVVLTGAPANTVFYAGVVYEASIYGLTQGTAAAVNTFRVRKTNTGGQQLMETRPVINGNTPMRDFGLFKVSGSNVTATLVVTLQAAATATWIAGAGFPRGFQVKAVGSENNPAYAGVQTLT